MLKDEVGLKLVAEPLQMRYAFCVDCEITSPAQAIELRKIVTTSTAVRRSKAKFPDPMHSLLSYTRVIRKSYDVHLVDVPLMDIWEDVMSLNFLAARSRMICTRCVRVGKMMINY